MKLLDVLHHHSLHLCHLVRMLEFKWSRRLAIWSCLLLWKTLWRSSNYLTNITMVVLPSLRVNMQTESLIRAISLNSHFTLLVKQDSHFSSAMLQIYSSEITNICIGQCREPTGTVRQHGKLTSAARPWVILSPAFDPPHLPTFFFPSSPILSILFFNALVQSPQGESFSLAIHS